MTQKLPLAPWGAPQNALLIEVKSVNVIELGFGHWGGESHFTADNLYEIAEDESYCCREEQKGRGEI
jgi:hypothetical protein